MTDQAVRDFMYAILDAIEQRGYQDLIFDFSPCDRAYPEAMLPIVATVDRLRSAGIGTSVMLPEDRDLARLFANCNWAHLLSPENHDPSDTVADRHLFVRRFDTRGEQHQGCRRGS